MERDQGQAWRFAGFCRDLNPQQRYNSWSLLKLLRNETTGPWLYMGDFNEIFHDNEKLNGSSQSFSKMAVFRDAVYACNLIDMVCKRDDYTWWNKQADARSVIERLNSIFFTLSQGTKFSCAFFFHLEFKGSNHWSLLLENISKKMSSNEDGKKAQDHFHFEEM